MPADIVLHFTPRSRAFTALWLLEELALPYELESFSLSANHHKSAGFLAMNPMGKVPVVVDHDVPISELGAIAIYLTDRYRDTVLSPALDSPKRAEFLRWIFFSSGIMEPAFGEKFFKWNVPASSVAWGSFGDMLRTLNSGLKPGPYLLGDTFSAADIIVGSTTRFGVMFGAIPDEAPITGYLERLSERPAFKRAEAIEAHECVRFPMPQTS